MATWAPRAVPGWQRAMGRQFAALESDDPIRPPKFSWRQRLQRSRNLLCSYRGVTSLVVIGLIVIMMGTIAATIYMADHDSPEDSPKTQTFNGTVTLKKLTYTEAAYGDPESAEYKTLASGFCSKMTTTLKKGGMEKDLQACRVNHFSSGSVRTHFGVDIQQYSKRDTGKEKSPADLVADIKRIVNEASGEDGLFAEYGMSGIEIESTEKTTTTTTTTTTTPKPPTTTKSSPPPSPTTTEKATTTSASTTEATTIAATTTEATTNPARTTEITTNVATTTEATTSVATTTEATTTAATTTEATTTAASSTEAITTSATTTEATTTAATTTAGTTTEATTTAATTTEATTTEATTTEATTTAATTTEATTTPATTTEATTTPASTTEATTTAATTTEATTTKATTTEATTTEATTTEATTTEATTTKATTTEATTIEATTTEATTTEATTTEATTTEATTTEATTTEVSMTDAITAEDTTIPVTTTAATTSTESLTTDVEYTTITAREDCTNNTCKHGGTCNDTAVGYKCICTPEYIGDLCEREKTFCEREQPCKHGGTCLDGGGSDYQCVCPKCGCSTVEPFINCTIDETTICKKEMRAPNNHAPHPYNCSMYILCKDDGTFLRSDSVHDSAKGHVFNPKNGQHDLPSNVKCSNLTEIKLCDDVECANNATCENTLSGYKCRCTFGYSGLMCEDRLSMCVNVSCNNGTCKDTSDGFHCTCTEDYVGINCETPKVDCSQVTCEMGGNCTNDTVLGFICTCEPGYTGEKCETDINECASNPCHEHYGRCVDKVDKYECVCSTCNCTSSVSQYDDCVFALYDINQRCISARAEQGDHGVYFLPHPYKCSKYVWCYQNGTYGADQYCTPTMKFNPDHDRDATHPCLPEAQVEQCVEI